MAGIIRLVSKEHSPRSSIGLEHSFAKRKVVSPNLTGGTNVRVASERATHLKMYKNIYNNIYKNILDNIL